MALFTSDSPVAISRRVLISAAVVVGGLLWNPIPRRATLLGQEVPLHTLAALLGGSGFVQIPPGEFQMGTDGGIAAEAPMHRVRISKGFEMGKLEVTQAQWTAIMSTAHSSPNPQKGAPAEAATDNNPSHFTGLTLPVEHVSWNEVHRFLDRLNARDPQYLYRLPTEAEWEYAAKAGRTTDPAGAVEEIAWAESNSGGRTWPAGQKKPNAWGLYDMQGNVAEWVQDWYGFDYYGVSPSIDPLGPESGSYRIYRGCSWLTPAADCRSALRTFNFPIDGYYNVGFRLVRTAK